MTAITSLTAPPVIRDLTVPPGARTMQPRGASTNFFPKGLVAHRAGSDLVEHPDPNNPRTDLIVMGIVQANAVFTSGTTTDANGGALDANGNAQSLLVETGIIGWFDTGTGTHKITNANVDQVCYLFDNNTLYLDNLNGTLSAAGYVAQVRADGKVKLRIDASVYLANQDPLPAATQDLTARAVATSVAAGSFSGGVLTATANGAFGTQDGVATLAVGDTVVLPVGTIGSLTVGAADSGPYEITSLGSGGSKFVLTRHPKWAHGAVITPGSQIRLGSEGTLFRDTRWYAAPATAAKVVGTDDPRLAPEKVLTQVTLVAGTVTISTVPIRDAARIDVGITLAGGTPAGTTTGYDNKLSGGITAGGIGTASLILEAQSVKGTKVGTDVSVLNVAIYQ